MLAPYPTRLRSHSSPGRPRGSPRTPEVAPRSNPVSSIGSVEEEASEVQVNWRPTPSSPPDTSNSHRAPRRRAKRPSSSSAAMDPTYTSDLRDITSPTSSQSSSRGSTSRPGKRRPSTSSGAPEHPPRVRSSSSTSDSSLFKGFGPIMGVRRVLRLSTTSILTGRRREEPTLYCSARRVEAASLQSPLAPYQKSTKTLQGRSCSLPLNGRS